MGGRLSSRNQAIDSACHRRALYGRQRQSDLRRRQDNRRTPRAGVAQFGISQAVNIISSLVTIDKRETLDKEAQMASADATMVRAEREMVKQAEGYKSPYERWKEAEGLPTARGYFVKNLLKLELAPWKSSGAGSAAVINLEGTGGFNDAYVAEIPPGKSLKPHKHLFEETIYILKGQGATSVWLDENKKQTFEWHAGSYFAIPMNAWHEHFNA